MPAVRLFVRRLTRTLTGLFAVALLVALWPPARAQAATLTIEGPPGSGYFGSTVTLLPNGFRPTAGPVTRHNSLVGSAPNDKVGGLAGIDIFNGVTPLGNDFYTVISSLWNRPPRYGAISIADRCTPLAGPITAANSLLDTQGSAIIVYDPATTQIALGIAIRNQVLVWRGCDHPAVDVAFQYLPVVRR